MPRRFLNEIKDGDAVDEVFLIADKQLRANRNAALYLSVDLRDRSGVVNGRMWNVTEQSVSHVEAGGYARIRGKAQLYQGALQIIVTHVDVVAADAIDPVDFQPQSPVNVAAHLAELQQILATVQRPELQALVAEFFDDEPLVASLCLSPAGVKAHHAYRGGLLEHIVSLSRLAVEVGRLYPELDRDLLLLGVFLHDLGKTRELAVDAGFSYTDEGQLLGHLVIGVEMLTEKLQQLHERTGMTIDTELVLRLKHLILSHHGTYDFGSPRLPMTPEGIALHLIDNLDAKIHEFSRAIADDPSPETHWTLFQPRLDRKLFKGARPAAESPTAAG